MRELALMFGAGVLAGAMNAIAGGGSFVTFPIMVVSGLPSVAANASSTVALFPGALASIWAYRRDMRGIAGLGLRPLLMISLAGGLCGAVLLLVTPSHTFDLVVPWLLLLATLAFAFGARIGPALRRLLHIGPRSLLLTQFLLSVYGGYFGGAVGIMMMAVWSLLDSADLKAVNPAKTALVGATNGIAVLCFILAGAVWWPQTGSMLIGAVIGGYGGARLARRLNVLVIRGIVLAISASVTAAFFWRS